MTRRQPGQKAESHFVTRLQERPPRFSRDVRGAVQLAGSVVLDSFPSATPMPKEPTVQPITDKRLAQVRRECVAFSHIPSSDVQRVLARLDAAESENTLLRRQQGATEGALSLGGENKADAME